MKIVPFRSEAYWNNNKIKIMNQCINIAESLIPGLSDHIVVKAVSTPATIYKYTRNYKGAIGGWALLPDQVGELRLSHNTVISNLYLAGHWTFPGIGVHNVARSGEFIAKKIIKNYLKEEHGR
jgi:prolycopene isomerase